MTIKSFTAVSAAIVFVLSLSSCGNTIRGVGKDAASTVNATQAAGNSVAKAAN